MLSRVSYCLINQSDYNNPIGLKGFTHVDKRGATVALLVFVCTNGLEISFLPSDLCKELFEPLSILHPL